MEMENFFSRLTLDIIGRAVFNYDFDSLTTDDPVIQVPPGRPPARRPARAAPISTRRVQLGAHAVAGPAGSAAACSQRGEWAREAAPEAVCRGRAAGGVHGAARGGVPQHVPGAVLERGAAALGGAAPAPLHRRAGRRQPGARRAHLQVQAPGAPPARPARRSRCGRAAFESEIAERRCARRRGGPPTAPALGGGRADAPRPRARRSRRRTRSLWTSS